MPSLPAIFDRRERCAEYLLYRFWTRLRQDLSNVTAVFSKMSSIKVIRNDFLPYHPLLCDKRSFKEEQ